jgi:hypothetical protein
VSWPQVCVSLGKGIEDWTVGGSSPEVWEVFQQRQVDPALTIVGVSVYDLNEMRLTPDRANYVPLAETIRDLWASGASPDLSRRILTQYAVRDVRFLFPAAGRTDKVLVGLRSKAAEALGLQAALENHEGVLVERDGVLDAGENTMKLSDWSAGRALRRLALLREENRGIHEFFHGPKRMALRRILLRAKQHGPVIVVILPVSRSYAQEFLNKSTLDQFERALKELMKAAPEAMFVRLDQVPGITDDGYFADHVHLNAYGRRLTTPVFLGDISEVAAKQNSQAAGMLSRQPPWQQ